MVIDTYIVKALLPIPVLQIKTKLPLPVQIIATRALAKALPARFSKQLGQSGYGVLSEGGTIQLQKQLSH